MKRIILLTFLTFSYLLGQSQGIQRWFEDFEGEANGAVAGTAIGTPGGTWSVTTTPSGGAASFSRQAHFYNRFTINNTGNEGVWATNVINISSTGQAAIDISLVTHYANSSDYVRAYYKLDGGPEVLFGEVLGSGYSIGSTASVVLTGSTLQLIVRGMDNTTGNNADGYPNMMRFDDVEVTQIATLYSRKTGNWGDNTAGTGTWSTVALGGVACGCAPDNTTNVVIGNSDVVSITAASDVVFATVQNTSTLQWTAGVALNFTRGGSLTISNTAQVNRNGNAAAQIVFPVAATVGVTVNSSNANALSIGDIIVTGAPALTFSGTGNIIVNRNVSVTNNATIVNNLAGTFSIAGTLTINSGNAATFTNAGPMTIAGVTTINTPSTFTNNNAVTMSSSGAAVLAGTGTWTQGATASSTLAYAGSTLTVTTFNASNTGNTVNYNRPGGATLRNPSANTYYNLTIAGTNTKSSSANHIVNNNLLISGSSANATLDPLTFNFTVNGTSTITLGAFNDSNDTGTNTFVGNVSVANGSNFTSTVVTTTGNLIFRGGIANAGTFAAGGATFNTNNQAVTGASAMSFANNVDISGVTVTNSNTGAFTVTGTTTLTNGGYTDSDNTSIATFIGAVSQSGTSAFNTTSVSTTANLIFRGGITNGGGTFTAGGATFNTNAQSIAGTTAISFANLVVITGIVVSNDNTSSVSLTANGLSLSGTGTWTQGTNSTLNFAGSSITVTTFNASSAGNTVNYNSGASGNAQTIRVPSAPTPSYINLTFNNAFATSPQLTAAGNISVTGILTMTDGNVNLNGNSFTLTSSAAGALVHNLTSAAGWMYGGSITRTFANLTAIAVANVAGLFPLGGSADFRPFFVSVNSFAGTAGTITVSHTYSASSTGVAFLDGLTPVLVRSNSFWAVSTATISAGTFGIRYGGTGLGTVSNITHVRSVLSAGVVATHVATSTVSTSDPRVERSGLAFGNLTNSFYVGSTNLLSPLPVKLLYFNADIDHDVVTLDWATAQENNNDFFTIEKSSNPEQGFQQVSKIPSHGNSTIEQKYAAVDRAPYSGLSYYRLKQTDFDGTSTYSKLVAVNYEGPTLASLKVYPNPLKDKKTVKVEITGLRGVSEIPLIIYNFLGQKVLEKIITVGSEGIAQEEFFFENPLATGVFVIKAGPTLQLIQRLVVE